MSKQAEKQALIFPGAGESAESIWVPNICLGLVDRGFTVRIPQLPLTSERPSLSDWLPPALALPYTNETVLIAHSAGSPLALSVLERLKEVVIRQVILVAGFCTPTELDEVWFEGTNPILQEAYDWDCIRRSVRQVLCLNSDDDPYGCNDKKGQQIVDGIGADKANLIVMAGQGHMGSDFFEQPYREFPFLLSLIG